MSRQTQEHRFLKAVLLWVSERGWFQIATATGTHTHLCLGRLKLTCGTRMYFLPLIVVLYLAFPQLHQLPVPFLSARHPAPVTETKKSLQFPVSFSLSACSSIRTFTAAMHFSHVRYIDFLSTLQSQRFFQTALPFPTRLDASKAECITLLSHHHHRSYRLFNKSSVIHFDILRIPNVERAPHIIRQCSDRSPNSHRWHIGGQFHRLRRDISCRSLSLDLTAMCHPQHF